MRFAIVGCGYVADFYLATLGNHPGLTLAGVYDRDEERARRFAEHHRVPRYRSLDEVLADRQVGLVANLTNPRSHREISAAALEAGKHVYSEKPLAMTVPEAQDLVALAERRGLLLASAPCSVLGETAQTMWKALRQGRIGTPRLAYAEIDDGPVPLLPYRRWVSASGAPWPYQDEFEVGCTLEHAGYYLTWLTAFFGPARRLTSFARVVLEDKGVPLSVVTPDLAIGCLEFDRGVTARLTCSIYGSHDHRLRIFGDAGVLTTEECWHYASPVWLAERTPMGFRAERHPLLAKLLRFGPRRLPLARRPRFRHGAGLNAMDFCRGIQDLADAASRGRAPRMSARWSLHVTELALAMQHPPTEGTSIALSTSFEPMTPMPWATEEVWPKG